jgi:hypothetical protein
MRDFGYRKRNLISPGMQHQLPWLRRSAIAEPCGPGKANACFQIAPKAAAFAAMFAAAFLTGCGHSTPPQPTPQSVAVSWEGLTTGYEGQTLVNK